MIPGLEVSRLLDEHDERSRRCPRLGHEVSFHYCRTQEGDRLCPRILDCWWETFDVESFVRGHWADEEVARVLAPPKDKRVTLMELIQRAREVAERTPAGEEKGEDGEPEKR